MVCFWIEIDHSSELGISLDTLKPRRSRGRLVPRRLAELSRSESGDTQKWGIRDTLSNQGGGPAFGHYN